LHWVINTAFKSLAANLFSDVFWIKGWPQRLGGFIHLSLMSFVGLTGKNFDNRQTFQGA
jgi:hypothetical protein